MYAFRQGKTTKHIVVQNAKVFSDEIWPSGQNKTQPFQNFMESQTLSEYHIFPDVILYYRNYQHNTKVQN